MTRYPSLHSIGLSDRRRIAALTKDDFVKCDLLALRQGYRRVAQRYENGKVVHMWTSWPAAEAQTFLGRATQLC